MLLFTLNGLTTPAVATIRDEFVTRGYSSVTPAKFTGTIGFVVRRGYSGIGGASLAAGWRVPGWVSWRRRAGDI